MARTALVYAPAALVLALGWLRLEHPHPSVRTIVWLLALALAPALARRMRERVLLAVVAAVLAAHTAFRLSIFHLDHLPARFRTGFLDFYDVPLPVDPANHPLMHGVLVAAGFGSCLALGLAIAARRPFVAHARCAPCGATPSLAPAVETADTLRTSSAGWPQLMSKSSTSR